MERKKDKLIEKKEGKKERQTDKLVKRKKETDGK